MFLTESSLRQIIRKTLIEAKDQNKDGKNDFRDVKIARMKASGMSQKQIKAKYDGLYEDEEEIDLEDGDLLVEPDMTSEDRRSKDVEEMSTLAGGSIRGYQAPIGYNNKKR